MTPPTLIIRLANGIVERFHKTVPNEFYRVAFRRKIYRSIGELQDDLDTWLIDAKKLEVVIDRVFPFAEAKEAIAYLETGRAKGKVVMAMI